MLFTGHPDFLLPAQPTLITPKAKANNKTDRTFFILKIFGA